MESLEAKGETNVKFFLLLVSGSSHVLTNQQFVNCAYLEILPALAPALPCLLTCRRASLAVPRLPSTTSHKQRTSGLLATGCAVS